MGNVVNLKLTIQTTSNMLPKMLKIQVYQVLFVAVFAERVKYEIIPAGSEATGVRFEIVHAYTFLNLNRNKK